MALDNLTVFSVIICIFIVHVNSVPILCGLQRTLLENSHDLLERMGGRFPMRCLQHNVAIEFPTSYFQSDDATKVQRTIYETLKFIDGLLENNFPPTAWDRQNLDAFQNIIYRQIEDGECIMIKSETLQDDFSSRESALRTYFSRVTILKDSGDCGWEVIRKELLYTFKFILQNCSGSLI